MSYSIWAIPTLKGREAFGWVNKRQEGDEFNSLDVAETAAYHEDCDDPAHDKDDYRRIVVLPEPGMWRGAGTGLIHVLGYHDNDNDNAIPSVRCINQGGGFEFTMDVAVFLKTMHPAVLTWIQVQVTGDWCDDESYEAWWDGTRWNGWIIPFFTPEEAGRMASRSSGLNLYHRVIDGIPTWLAAQADEEDADAFPLANMNVGNNVATKLFGIGAMCWCWELADVGGEGEIE